MQKQRRGFKVSTDPTIHQRILTYQNRLLDHLLHPNVLLRFSNSSLYGNDYKLPYYMTDLRNSIFESDFKIKGINSSGFNHFDLLKEILVKLMSL